MPDEPLDPQEVFKKDQAQAAEQEETRDQESWTLNVRNGAAQAAYHEGLAAKETAKAALYLGAAALLRLAAFAVVVWALVQLISAIVGWVR